MGHARGAAATPEQAAQLIDMTSYIKSFLGGILFVSCYVATLYTLRRP